MILRRQPVFERISLTEEDLNKGRLYAQQLKRRELQRNTVTIEEYWQSLGMEMEIVPNSEKTLERVTQLTQKTNQFNMTTKRYSIQQIKAMNEDPCLSIYAFLVQDRFGDNGIVGVAILSHLGDECEVDTFLMSCRVIGRTMETAMIDTVIKEAEKYWDKRNKRMDIPNQKKYTCKGLLSETRFFTGGEKMKVQRNGCWNFLKIRLNVLSGSRLLNLKEK